MREPRLIQERQGLFLGRFCLGFLIVNIRNPLKESNQSCFFLERKKWMNERTLWTPMASCLYVVLNEMGGITAPVSGLGSEPTWMTLVPNPSTRFLRGLEWWWWWLLPVVWTPFASKTGDIIGGVNRNCSWEKRWTLRFQNLLFKVFAGKCCNYGEIDFKSGWLSTWPQLGYSRNASL